MRKMIAASLNIFLFLGSFGVFEKAASAQVMAELRGTVTDETGAIIAAAPATLDDGKGNKYATQTDETGRYRFTRVVPGVYTLTVVVEGFAPFNEEVNLVAGRPQSVDVTLIVFIEAEVDVKDDRERISTEPDKNLSAITLNEQDLEALPDDPDELLEALRQMAGASGGPGDAAVYVGGFRERGRIPPKEAIQMIRINSNPFAAEFSEPGFSRIEIVTKPGSDTYRGTVRFDFNDEALNARNAFAPSKAPFQTRSYSGSFSGPIIRNRWGFFFDIDRREDDENDVIRALVLNPTTLAPEPFSTSILTPRRRTNFSVRSDYLVTNKHTIGFQYRFATSDAENEGLGSGFDLPERAYSRSTREDTYRFSLTSIASERAVNEIRLQFSRRGTDTRSLNDAPKVEVVQAFTFGGNQESLFLDNSEDNLQFNNDLSYSYKKHTLKLGFRADAAYLRNNNRSNFGGTFTFGTDFERNANGVPIVGPDGSPTPISALELYRRVLLGEAGYRATQFSINRGDPLINFSQWELGWYLQDDWKVSERLTFSYGVRHEFQTHLQDRINFAPRAGLAWATDKNQKGTVRAGAGVFYSRLDSGITFDTIRFDGSRQQQLVISRPGFFPDVPDILTGAVAREPTIRLKAENLNAPYTILSTISYDRQLPFPVIGSIAYTFNRGVHLLRTRNINAPIGIDPESGATVLPFPNQGPLLQFESTGLSTRHELRLFLRTNPASIRAFQMFGGYTLGSMKSDTDNAYATPADPFDLSNEWGRSSADARHRVHFGGFVTLPWGLRAGSFVNASSATPFNIRTGRDNNQDTVFSDRPAFANAGEPNAITTPFGIFNPNPQPGDVIIPRNFGLGTGQVNASLNVSKTFGFGAPRGGARAVAASQPGERGRQRAQAGPRGAPRGPGGGGGPRGGFVAGRMGGGGFFGGSANRYSLTIDVRAENVLNTPNLSQYNGVLTSTLFGTANRARERRIRIGMRFTF